MITDKLDDPNDALSFSGVMLMPEQVAERVERLLDKPKPVLTIPRWRGRFARFFDRHPELSLRLTPLLMRDARPPPARFKKKVESGKWPPKLPLRGPHDPGTRAGRFHTARGPMRLSGWLRYPAAWWRARRGRTPERPWIVPASIGWLRRRIRSDWSVLELGSGRSTAWFARRAGAGDQLRGQRVLAPRHAERLDEAGL